MGSAFVTAIKNALDRNGDGQLSCAEYEMLANKCQFVDKGEGPELLEPLFGREAHVPLATWLQQQWGKGSMAACEELLAN